MNVTLLDGGMGQELVHRHGGAPTPLWSTSIMMDSPHLVRAVHDDFFAAGATIATTNTYAVLRDRLEPHGLGDQFEALQKTACELAVAARDAHGCGRVAGALGPLGASYRPDLAPPSEIAAQIYAEVVALQAPHVDMIICETMSSVDQARGAVMGAQTVGKPVWLALSVDDADGTCLRSGEPLEDARAVIDELHPDAVLLNCSRPEAIDQGLPIVARFGLPFGAYANAFTIITENFRKPGATVDALSPRADLTPDAYADFAMGWVDQGATLIGGCCEVGPSHIAELASRLGNSQ